MSTMPRSGKHGLVARTTGAAQTDDVGHTAAGSRGQGKALKAARGTRLQELLGQVRLGGADVGRIEPELAQQVRLPTGRGRASGMTLCRAGFSAARCVYATCAYSSGCRPRHDIPYIMVPQGIGWSHGLMWLGPGQMWAN